jgi:signal transduction histidine kinase
LLEGGITLPPALYNPHHAIAMPIAIERKYDLQNIAAKILMLLIGLFLIYMLLTSGSYRCNIFWLFIYPPAAFFILSRPAASSYTAFFLISVVVILLLESRHPPGFQHESGFKVVFFACLFLVASISYALRTSIGRHPDAISIKTERLGQAQPNNMAEALADNSAISDAKNAFLANMSHELRTPLNHMIGFTELVVDQKFGKLNQTQREYLNDALQSSKYLFALINDILDLKKIETGDLELVISDIDVKTLLENSLTMIRERALNHGIKVSIDMNGAPMMLRADQDKLTQILYNLLSNAAKFTPDGGLVTVSAKIAEINCRRSDHRGGVKSLWTIQTPGDLETSADIEPRKCVKFVVSDSGVGINPADLERIFEHFEQADGSSRKRFQGTGLGLFLCKRYVELHGGCIWADTAGEGKGSTFSFVIPSQAGEENA